MAYNVLAKARFPARPCLAGKQAAGGMQFSILLGAGFDHLVKSCIYIIGNKSITATRYYIFSVQA